MAYVDPEIWFQRLPTFYAAAGAIIRDEHGNILLVKTTYREAWQLPGGTVEADETPDIACEREVREELGLVVRARRLLVLDWSPVSGMRPRPLIHFLFDCGTAGDREAIRLQEDEIQAYRFCTPQEIQRRLAPHAVGRVSIALQAAATASTVYFPSL